MAENCRRCGGLRLAACSATARTCDVPRDPGIGGGDDVHFLHCLHCGQIRGRFPLPPTAIEDGRD